MPFGGEYKYQSDLQKMSQRDIATWMLDGMNILPSGRPGDETPATLYKDLYDKERPQQKIKLASALTDAISIWHPDNNSLEILRELCIATAFTNNEKPIHALTRLIDEHKIVGENEEVQKTRLTVISTVSSFLDYPEHHVTALRWYQDPAFEWRGKYIIFGSFAYNNPSEIEPLLPEFLHLIEDHFERNEVNLYVDALRMNLGKNRVQKMLTKHNSSGATLALQSLEHVSQIT